MSSSVTLPTLGLELPGVTYIGPMMDDLGLAEAIPHDLSALLIDVNGFIAFNGTFHVRGITSAPSWHSLEAAWKGERAIHRLFRAISPDDIPFAQDALGDQFIVRGEHVWHLYAETGELESTGLDIQDFVEALIETPAELLPTWIVQRFRDEGGSLLPGQLLNVYPPLCTKESERGMSVRAIPAEERIAFLADFASQIRDAADEARIEIRIVDDGGTA